MIFGNGAACTGMPGRVPCKPCTMSLFAPVQALIHDDICPDLGSDLEALDNRLAVLDTKT